VIKEVSNAIWKHAYLHRRISRDLGLKLYVTLKRLKEERVIVLEDQQPYIDRAFEISLNQGITVYDALYVAQALKYGELLTSDVKQRDVAKRMGVETYYIE